MQNKVQWGRFRASRVQESLKSKPIPGALALKPAVFLQVSDDKPNDSDEWLRSREASNDAELQG